jgi:L-ascorbate metabolism protein UlaG (beta-lactamase superfamily)
MSSEVFRDPFPTGRWRGPKSDHFDGRRFSNLRQVEHVGVTDFVRSDLATGRGRWRIVDEEPGPPPPTRVARGLRVTFVGHATLLVQIDGLNVLTDPVWGERSSPVSFAGPRRYRAPGIRWEDLPPIDVALISHDHYDHLCAPTVRRLAAEHDPRIVSGLGNGAFLSSLGARDPIELDWWQSTELASGTKATFVPAQHFSGRGLRDRDTTLWGGLVLESPSARVYFAGDTGMGPHFAMIRERLGAPDLALLPIGAYRPAWFMRRVHVSPGEAVEAARILGARTSVGMHFGTFRVAFDGMDEPVNDLYTALDALGADAPEFWVLGHGEGRDVPTVRASAPTPGARRSS